MLSSGRIELVKIGKRGRFQLEFDECGHHSLAGRTFDRTQVVRTTLPYRFECP